MALCLARCIQHLGKDCDWSLCLLPRCWARDRRCGHPLKCKPLVPCALGDLRDTVPCVRRTVTKYFVSGLCMGAADLVPGVSGGTVALLFGVYENLLKQISKLFTIFSLLARFNFKSARKELRNVDWQFLCSLGIGIGIAVVTLAAWLSRQIEDHPVHQ